ncbi:MAG: PHP domain-containing protein [Clostridiales bacterium]|nr:PHP domain-containing protein [Clostridiales bacterium]
MSRIENLVDRLNAPDKKDRLSALSELCRLFDNGEIKRPDTADDVNNHIHTTYSFSPYSPTKAVWMAYNAGLKTAGIMDHDSVGGVDEFTEAGKTVGIMTTIGVECRVKMHNTPLAGKRINNPDQKSIAYIALHGIPHQYVGQVRDFFTPYTAARIERGRRMTERINDLMADFDISLDFDDDILPLSMAHDSGSVTERHILFALSRKIIERFGKGEAVLNFLEKDLIIPISSKVRSWLSDKGNTMYDYDLLGALKSDLVEKIYIDADTECPDVKEVLALSREIGAISAYAYLGDVSQSVTGDKKTQTFEDGYLDLLFETLKTLGFNAVTYMPSRNTKKQLRAVRNLCDQYGLFQISGEDINSPRQSFICLAQRDPEFAHLQDAALALIGHEIAATNNVLEGMFSERTIKRIPDLSNRIKHFKSLASIRK